MKPRRIRNKNSHQEEENLHIIQYFLACTLAGGDPKLLSDPSLKNDLNKYTLLGLTILFTGVFAGASGSYAAWTFSRYWLYTIIGGSIWGSLITTLDALMMHQSATEVEEVKKNSGNQQEPSPKDTKKIAKNLAKILLRMGFATGIGMFMATPLVLGIFRDKIDAHIIDRNNQTLPAKIETIKKQTEGERNQLNTELQEANKKRETIQAQQQDASNEIPRAFERGGAGRGERVHIAEENRKRIDAEAEKLDVTINDTTKKLNDLKAREQKQIEDLKKALEASKNSLPTQLAALAQLEKEDESIHSMKISIEVLIIFIEIVPQLMKLLGGKGAYEITLVLSNRLRTRQASNDLSKENREIRLTQESQQTHIANVQGKLMKLIQEENDLNMANLRNPNPDTAEKLAAVRKQINELSR
jgi:hypothetical protein